MRKINPLNTEIRAEIRAIRQSLGVSQRVMAAMIGTNRNIYADYELGRTRLPADVYIRVKAMAPKKHKPKKG